MADLKNEYTDAKGVKHPVEHLKAAGVGKMDKEQLLQELITTLTGKDNRISE